jgi:hypothetical protein
MSLVLKISRCFERTRFQIIARQRIKNHFGGIMLTPKRKKKQEIDSLKSFKESVLETNWEAVSD